MDTRREEAPPKLEAPNDDVADAAVFALERVPRARGLKPAGAIVLVIGALAAAGAVLNLRPAAVSTALATSLPQDVQAAQDAQLAQRAAASSTRVDTASSEHDWGAFKNGDDRAAPPPLLSLAATTDGSLVFIHGDVYTRGALYVVVRIADSANGTLDVRALNMPGGSTAFRTGPNDRFSVAFRLLDPLTRPAAWVAADAYDHNGAIIATARVAVLGA